MVEPDPPRDTSPGPVDDGRRSEGDRAKPLESGADEPSLSARDGADGSDPSEPASVGAGTIRGIRVAAALLALESALGIIFGVLVLTRLTSEGVAAGVFFLVYGAGLALCARGLLRLQRWVRGPVVLVEVIEIGVASDILRRSAESISAPIWVAVLLLVPAVVVLAILFSRGTTRALYGERESDAFRYR
ncbi:MAG TPA: hypothetical protein VFI30_05830 [Nocardioidaceae bacterium]|nr:hypothetical protein [Nocardioidaceae bacterium]